MKKITKQALELLAAPSQVRYEKFNHSLHGYVPVPVGISRQDLANALEAGGCKIDRTYWPNGTMVEVTNVKVGS